jgi:hypothetical protein
MKRVRAVHELDLVAEAISFFTPRASRARFGRSNTLQHFPPDSRWMRCSARPIRHTSPLTSSVNSDSGPYRRPVLVKSVKPSTGEEPVDSRQAFGSASIRLAVELAVLVIRNSSSAPGFFIERWKTCSWTWPFYPDNGRTRMVAPVPPVQGAGATGAPTKREAFPLVKFQNLIIAL